MIRSTITIRESRGTLSHRKSNTFSVSKMVDAVPLQSDFGRYIINDGAKTRRRDRREDKRRLACEEAVTKSRLSCHMVKFENSIKVVIRYLSIFTIFVQKINFDKTVLLGLLDKFEF